MQHAPIGALLYRAFGCSGRIATEGIYQHVLQFCQAERVEPAHRVGVDVAVEVHAGQLAQRVALGVAALFGIVVAVQVVEESTFRVRVLAGKAQIDLSLDTVAVRVLLGVDVAEGIAVPAPYDALISAGGYPRCGQMIGVQVNESWCRSEEHTSELQSRENLVCRLL